MLVLCPSHERNMVFRRHKWSISQILCFHSYDLVLIAQLVRTKFAVVYGTSKLLLSYFTGKHQKSKYSPNTLWTSFLKIKTLKVINNQGLKLHHHIQNNKKKRVAKVAQICVCPFCKERQECITLTTPTAPWDEW